MEGLGQLGAGGEMSSSQRGELMEKLKMQIVLANTQELLQVNVTCQSISLFYFQINNDRQFEDKNYVLYNNKQLALLLLYRKYFH